MMKTHVVSLSLVLSFLPHLILSYIPPDANFHSNIKCSREKIRNCCNKLSTQQISAYEANRNKLLSNFTPDTEIDFGYYASSVGEGSDKVYGQALCRGDVEPDSCLLCFNEAKTSLPKVCQTQKGAFGYNDLCTFQYSNYPLKGRYLDPPYAYSFNNPEDARDAASYTAALNVLMQRLKSDASSGDDDYKFAAGSETSANSETVYAIAQCMPDLSHQDCDACLQDAISEIPPCCLNKVGGRVIKYSCHIRFEKVKFYNDV